MLPRIVVGGDLNAEPDEVTTLQDQLPLLGGLARINAPEPAAAPPRPMDTGLSATFAEPVCIDHLFVSPGLRLTGQLARERPPASPFVAASAGPAPVRFASDHVWQTARLAVD